jgi:hypothetical protein
MGRRSQVSPDQRGGLYAGSRESGGSGFETRSGVIPQAALLQCGLYPVVD